MTPTSTFLDDVKEWSGPFFDAQQLGVRLNFDVDVKSAVQTDEVEVDITQCENRFTCIKNNLFRKSEWQENGKDVSVQTFVRVDSTAKGLVSRAFARPGA